MIVNDQRSTINDQRGISVSFFHQLVHTSFELIGENFHGVQVKWGMQFGIFDAITVRTSFVDEVNSNNDRRDAFEFTVGVQLSGLIRALTQ